MPKFLVSSAALLRCLKEVAPVVKRNPVVPILANVLLSITNNALSVVGSDLENTITTKLPIEGDAGEWATCPPIKPLMEVLKNLPDQPIIVRFDAEKDKLTVEAGVEGTSENVTVHGAKYTFACEKSADFPRTPVGTLGVEITFPGHLLRTAFGYTAELVSNDELRPAMMAVCVIASTAGVDFLATDGHRLCIYEVQAGKEPGYACEMAEGISKTMLLPQQAVKALKHLVKNDDVVTVTSGPKDCHLLHFQIGTYGPELVVWPYDEKYPDVYYVLPTEFPGGTLTLARPAARTMLNRMLPFAGSASNRLDLLFSGTSGLIQGENDCDDVSAREPLPGTFAPGSEPFKAIGFNARFLAHLFMLLPGPRVRLHFVSPSKGCLLTADGADGLKYLLMPIMITDYN